MDREYSENIIRGCGVENINEEEKMKGAHRLNGRGKTCQNNKE